VVDAFIVDALRTPIGKRNGSLSQWQAHQLAAVLIRSLLERLAIDPLQVDEVVLGNAAGPGGNPARVALLEAGLPVSIPGVTVDRQCGSGLEAILYGARMVQSGAADCVLAGGVESVSTAPLRANRDDMQFYERAAFAPAWMDDPDMGVAAENVAAKYGISRQQQDEFAYLSHRKAAVAARQGDLACESLPLARAPMSVTKSPASLSVQNLTPVDRVERDECIRADCSLDALAQLEPVFLSQGSVTAGNACPLNDGAALVCIVSEKLLATVKGDHLVRFMDASAAGVEPALLGTGPIPSTQKLFARVDRAINSVDAIEFNEAFAAQVLACVQALDMDPESVNQRGGAIAIGHPFGASGALLVTRLYHQLRQGQTGLATIGIGGGLGLSALFESV